MCQVGLSVTGGQANTYSLGLNETQSPSFFSKLLF